MLVLFPCDPLDEGRPDPEYLQEAEMALGCGHLVDLVSWEALVRGEVATAIGAVSEFEEEIPAIYRGWMLTPEQYKELYEALEVCSVKLITTPEQYKNAHYLPGWYTELSDVTPESVWVPKEEIKDVSSLVAIASDMAPCVIKDYVKSRKHEWDEACFIPNAESAKKVVSTFLERQDDLQGGVVFRKFDPLKPIGKHPDSGMPMSEEFRIFWIYGRIAGIGEYWDPKYYEGQDFPIPEPEEGGPTTYRVPDALETLPHPEEFAVLAQKIDNPFIAMDIAHTEDDEWIVIEVGDAQVSTLPQGGADAELLYRRLRQYVDVPPPSVMTQKDLDGMTCAEEGCDHKGHSTRFVFHSRCHMDSPTWVAYEGGILTIICAECELPVGRVLVHPGDVVKH